MNKTTSGKMPLGSISGFLVILFFYTASLLSAMLFATPYSPTTNFISDLGNLDYNPSGHYIFDLGCVLSGIALIAFVRSMSIWRQAGGEPARKLMIVQFIGYVTAVSIMMVGTFSSDLGAIHFFWATLFFVSLIVFISAVSLMLRDQERYGERTLYFSILPVVTGIIYIVTFALGSPSPLLEWLAVTFGLIWIGLLGRASMNLRAHDRHRKGAISPDAEGR